MWVFPKNNGTPKSFILIEFFIINHPFWSTPVFGNTHVHSSKCRLICHVSVMVNAQHSCIIHASASCTYCHSYIQILMIYWYTLAYTFTSSRGGVPFHQFPHPSPKKRAVLNCKLGNLPFQTILKLMDFIISTVQLCLQLVKIQVVWAKRSSCFMLATTKPGCKMTLL